MNIDFSRIQQNLQLIAVIGAGIILLWIVISIYQKYRRHESGVIEYNEALRTALSQTQLTPQDLDRLAGIKSFYHLSDKEVKEIHITQFYEVFLLTPPETFVVGMGIAKLEGIRKALLLSDNDIADVFQEIERIKKRSQIARGSLPEVKSPVSLKEGEICHFVEDCVLLEGEISLAEGVYFEFAKRATFSREGGLFKIPRKRLSTTDSGKLVITSHRVSFLGQKGPLQFEYGKLKGLRVYMDAISFVGTGNRVFLLFDPETAAVIASKVAQEFVLA